MAGAPRRSPMTRTFTNGGTSTFTTMMGRSSPADLHHKPRWGACLVSARRGHCPGSMSTETTCRATRSKRSQLINLPPRRIPAMCGPAGSPCGATFTELQIRGKVKDHEIDVVFRQTATPLRPGNGYVFLDGT